MNITVESLRPSDGAKVLVDAKKMASQSPNFEYLKHTKSGVEYTLANYIAALEKRISDLEDKTKHLNFYGPND
jgi:hypothetical protein